MKYPAEKSDLQPLKREKLSDQVVQAIQNYVIRNDLENGDRLPSEREFAQTLNVGTRSVREALKNLEARGMVRIEQGRGVFLDEKYHDEFIRFLSESLELALTRDKELLIELMYVRKIIETSVIADITANHNDGMLSGLEEIVKALGTAHNSGNQDEYNRLDVLFHKTLIDATKNRILIALYERLTSLLLQSFTKTGYEHGSSARSLKDHHKILNCIANGDSEHARLAMTTHLEKTMQTLKKHIKNRGL